MKYVIILTPGEAKMLAELHERSHPKTLLDIVNTAFTSLAAQR